MTRRVFVVLSVLALALTAMPAGAAPRDDTPTADRLAELLLPTAIETTIDVPSTEGRVEVSVRLTEPSLALGGSVSTIDAQQAAVRAALAGIDSTAVVTGSVSRVLNALFIEMDAAAVADLAAVANVTSIREVGDYELDLSETVPYIGGSAVQAGDVDGSGVVVAVLDSGIDYTHAALGGGGTLADYDAAYADPAARDGLFPTAKVIDGFDFVGEVWPFGPRTEDDDPIDFEGHGTHVSDIIAGAGGVAPGASLVGVKVCSAVSSSCNGVALIKGMEYAVDLGVDVINMSLGSIYGQAFDDDLAAAVEAATAEGVLTVASAGNSSNKPYVTGTPAAAPSALSVAQTQVPSAGLQLIDAESVTGIPAVFQPWSVAPTALVSGPVQYGDGAGGNLNGCAPFAPGSLAGKVVLVDRGACNFTLKIKNVGDAGGVVGIIGLVAPGDPFSGGDGGDRPITIPGYMISQADSNALKAVVGETVTVDPANILPLVGQLVGSSARGPSMTYNLIKPEIGAPGASVSAEVGTGTETTPFGGTSGAAPMVSGSAALLLSSEPGLIPAEVKARLINTAETDIDTDPFSGLAPITRIGGGEVRVDRAVASDAAAWDANALQGALSFGFVDATGVATASKTILVKNYGSSDLTFDITPTFRYGSDAALGAVTPSAPASITVPADGTTTFDLDVTIDGSKLSDWYGNSGNRGASTGWLDDLEIDGYLMLDADGDANDIHLPWHVLPRKSADIDVSVNKKNFTLTNDGAGDALIEAYNLVATSADLPEGAFGDQNPIIDFRAAGVSVTPASFCPGGAVLQFAVNTWERQTHANAPALFEFDIDTNNDGVIDYAVFNADLSYLSPSFNLSDGRNVTIVLDVATGAASAFFFTDHETNSANTVLLACSGQLGYESLSDLQQQNPGVAFAVDVYFQGAITDIVPARIGPGREIAPIRIGSSFVQAFSLPSGASVNGRLAATDAGDLGALLLIRGGAPEGEEAIILGR